MGFFNLNTGSGGSVSGGWDPENAGAPLKLLNSNTEVETATQTSWQSTGVRSVNGQASGSGKWYAELLVQKKNGNSNSMYFGLADNASDITYMANQVGTANHQYTVGSGAFNSNTGAGTVTSGAAFAFTAGDVVGLAYDAIGHTVTFYKNNVSQLTIGGLEAVTFYLGLSLYDTGAKVKLNSKAGQFTYTPPAGYTAWES